MRRSWGRVWIRARPLGITPAGTSRRYGLAELGCVEPGVESAPAHEFLMRPLLYQVAIMQDKDFVGFEDRREPVGDHERRASLHDGLQRFLDSALGLAVQRRGGF